MPLCSFTSLFYLLLNWLCSVLHASILLENKRHSHMMFKSKIHTAFWLVSFILFTLHQLHHIVCWITILLRPLLQDLMLHMLWTSLHQSPLFDCFALVVCPARVIYVPSPIWWFCSLWPLVLMALMYYCPLFWIFISVFILLGLLEPSSITFPSFSKAIHSNITIACCSGFMYYHLLLCPHVIVPIPCTLAWKVVLFWLLVCDFSGQGVLTIWLTFWYYSPVPILIRVLWVGSTICFQYNFNIS